MNPYKQLKEIRKIRKLTQQQLSQRLHLPQGYISQVESGKHDIKLSTLTDWARVLGLEFILLPTAQAREVSYLIQARSTEKGKQLPPAYGALPESMTDE